MICDKCIKSDVCKLYDKQYVGCISFVSKTRLEDIRAEINELSELDHENDGEYGSYEDCKFDVLQIIDKHIGKEKE